MEIRITSYNVCYTKLLRIPSTPVENASSILLLAGGVEVVGIDEAQFFDNSLIDVCTMLADSGTRVIVAGLDMDFAGSYNFV